MRVYQRWWYPTATATATILLIFLSLSDVTHHSNAFGGLFPSPTTATTSAKSKAAFLESLETLQGLNTATKEQTQLVKIMTLDNPTLRPGSAASFRPLAAGTWKVIYAPHMSTMSQLVGGQGFNPVIYDLKPDGTMVSHARFDIGLPLLPSRTISGWLSVSGTYGSQDENKVCRVDFDKAWIKWNDNSNNDNNDTDQPYATLEDVPSSAEKTIIQTMGKWLFIDSVSVFPVSYLDNELIVFDFELLGTRICARKVKSY